MEAWLPLLKTASLTKKFGEDKKCRIKCTQSCMRGSKNFSLGIFYRPFKNSLALIRFPLSFSLVYNFFTHFVISKSLGGLLSVYFFCVEKNVSQKLFPFFLKKEKIFCYFMFLISFMDLTYITWNFWVRIGFKGVENANVTGKY